MRFLIFFVLLFVHSVISLQCKTASPGNCLHNSTCEYKTKECEKKSGTSTNRGGIYCTTIVKKEGDDLIIGTMDCMYDQETTKICKNRSECSLKYTNEEKEFLHCCCDEDLCNLNLTISDPSPLQTLSSIDNSCEAFLCRSISWIIFSLIIGLIFLLMIISFLSRKQLKRSLRKCLGFIQKTAPIKDNEKPETVLFLPSQNERNDQEIPSEQFTIGNVLKRGRFSTIHRGSMNGKEIAIKILISNNSNDQPRTLFEHEKDIYSLPLMTHPNILKYYGYSIIDDKLCLISALSLFGSLKDVLRSRLLNDEEELFLILQQITEGLHFLHTDYRNQLGLRRAAIAHRDLKTDNILYLNSNQIVLSDFAMSTIIEQNGNGQNQEQQIGTARYMSPEILAGTIGCEETALLKCDVYALGIIFWEVLSRFPFENLNGRYIQPFEEQLIKKGFDRNNPGVNEMFTITHLTEPFNRPLINQSWIDCNSPRITSIIDLMKDCWEQIPESRISSGVVLNRILQLKK